MNLSNDIGSVAQSVEQLHVLVVSRHRFGNWESVKCSNLPIYLSSQWAKWPKR